MRRECAGYLYMETADFWRPTWWELTSGKNCTLHSTAFTKRNWFAYRRKLACTHSATVASRKAPRMEAPSYDKYTFSCIHRFYTSTCDANIAASSSDRSTQNFRNWNHSSAMDKFISMITSKSIQSSVHDNTKNHAITETFFFLQFSNPLVPQKHYANGIHLDAEWCPLQPSAPSIRRPVDDGLAGDRARWLSLSLHPTSDGHNSTRIPRALRCERWWLHKMESITPPSNYSGLARWWWWLRRTHQWPFSRQNDLG